MNGRNLRTGTTGIVPVDFLITFLRARVERARSGDRKSVV